MMRKARAFGAAIFGWRKHGAAEQHHAVRVLVIAAHGVLDQLLRIAADLRHRAVAFQHEVIATLDTQMNLRRPYIVQRKVLVEQTDEGADCAGGIVVFGRSEEHTSELQSLMRISYAVFCLKKKITTTHTHNYI